MHAVQAVERMNNKSAEPWPQKSDRFFDPPAASSSSSRGDRLPDRSIVAETSLMTEAYLAGCEDH